jgi:hypothetical protein
VGEAENPAGILRASEVIAQLQTLMAAHGDLYVVLLDADTGWFMKMDLAYDTGAPWPEAWPHFEVSGGYDKCIDALPHSEVADGSR